MSEKNRRILISLLLAAEGALLALIGFAGIDQLIGFGSGFGAVMVILGLVEAGRGLSRDSAALEKGTPNHATD